MKKLLLVILILLMGTTAYALRDYASTAVDLTPSGTFVDVGSELNVKNSENVGMFINTAGQDASGIRFRVLAKTDSAGTSEYYMPDLRIASDLTLDQNDFTVTLLDLTDSLFINVRTNRVIDYLQLTGASTHVVTTAGNAQVTSFKIKQNK